MPPSRPKPRPLTPPKGTFGALVGKPLTVTEPTSRCRARRLSPGQCLGVHVGGQAVGQGVGPGHDLVLVGEGEDGQHRAEDLVAGHVAVVVDVGQDGGGQEPPAGQLGPRSSAPRARPPVRRVAPAPIACSITASTRSRRCFGGQRSHDGGRVQGIAHGGGLDQGHDPVHQLVGDGLVDEEAGRQGAALAAEEDRTEQPADGGCRVEVGVGEDDVGRLAAQFEGQASAPRPLPP